MNGMYKSKSGKNWVEMDTKELREEIAHLILLLDKTTQKNKKRKRALKDMNKSILIGYKSRMDVMKKNEYLSIARQHAEGQKEAAQETMKDLHHELRNMAQYAGGIELQLLILAKRHGYSIEELKENNRLVKEENGPPITNFPKTKRWFDHIFPRGTRGTRGA